MQQGVRPAAMMRGYPKTLVDLNCRHKLMSRWSGAYGHLHNACSFACSTGRQRTPSAWWSFMEQMFLHAQLSNKRVQGVLMKGVLVFRQTCHDIHPNFIARTAVTSPNPTSAAPAQPDKLVNTSPHREGKKTAHQLQSMYQLNLRVGCLTHYDWPG